MSNKTFRRIPIRKGHKTVYNRKRCMDVEGGNIGENARMVSFPCHTGPNQQFKYNKNTKQIIAKHSGKCVDIVKNRLFQKTCSAKKTQKWTQKNKKWRSLANRKCINSEITTDAYGSRHLITDSCKK